MANEFKVKNGIITPTLQSTVATGTAPLTVASTTLVSNLNADLLDGNHASDFASASHTHSYLPLAGGTMTGVITTPNGTHGIVIGDDSRLADRNVANTLFVEGAQNTDRGYINFSATSGNSLGAINGGALTWNSNTIWHAGNDGTGSGLDADTLDGNHASAFALSAHTHNYAGSASAGGPATNAIELNVQDLRSTALTPSYFGQGVNAAFMTNTTDGLSDGGTYHGVLQIQQWTDASGGGAHQLGFTDNNNLWIRGSSGALTSWSSWKKVWDSGNLTNLNQLTNGPGYTTNTGTVTSVAAGSYLTGGTITTSGTLAVDATSANTASKVVARDASGNFSAGIITAALSGNASTATTLQTARNINGVSFNGSADITVADSTKLPLAGGTMTGAITFAAGQTWPTFNQNTTGTASNVTGTVAIANGGTGATSAAAALTNLGAAAATHTHNYAGSASAGGPATHIAGGSAGTIPYQTAAGTTAMTSAGTTGQLLQSNGTSAPSWTSFDLAVHAPDSSYKKVVRVATTADLGASTFAGNVLTGYSNSVALNVTTTAASTAATTTSTAGIKVGATISGNANIPAGATVASITNATTFVMSAAATAAGTAVATTFTQTISQLVVDGVAVAVNDRVLVKDERTLGGLLDATSAKRNGIYTVTATGSTSVPWTLTRAADADAATDLDSAIVNVSVGTSNFGKTYQTRFSGTSTLNTTEMYWTRVVDVNSSSLAATPTTARGVHIDTDTETIMFKSGTITDLAMNAFGITTVQATAASTYTRGSTLYIAGAPVASTNATITTPYSLYIAAGNSYLGAGVNLGGITDTTTPASHYYVETGSDGFIRPKTLAYVKGEILGNSAVTFAGPTAARTYTLPDATTTLAANNQTMYIGTTAVAINRASASLALTGITSIDGSAATLTTARTLTIGSTGKTFNGSANVSWTLAEIGAADASHTHSYLPLAGGTMTGAITFAAAQTWPTFNQNTTGTASNVTGTVAITNGGTGATSAAAALTNLGAAAASHTHSYLPLAGGTITGATSITASTASTSTTTGALIVTGGVGVGGAIYAGGNVSANSDERLKHAWQDLQQDYVEQLANIKHGTYTRIDSGERQVGVSAQSLQQILPEAVDGTEYLAVAYGNAALVSAVQLAKRVVEQDARIAKLEALVSQLLEQKQ